MRSYLIFEVTLFTVQPDPRLFVSVPTLKRKSKCAEAAAKLQAIVSALHQAPSLRRPPPNAKIVLETDFSQLGLGAVLYFEENHSIILSVATYG